MSIERKRLGLCSADTGRCIPVRNYWVMSGYDLEGRQACFSADFFGVCFVSDQWSNGYSRVMQKRDQTRKPGNSMKEWVRERRQTEKPPWLLSLASSSIVFWFDLLLYEARTKTTPKRCLFWNYSRFFLIPTMTYLHFRGVRIIRVGTVCSLLSLGSRYCPW